MDCRRRRVLFWLTLLTCLGLTAATPVQAQTNSSSPELIGAGSCAAAGCHGGTGRKSATGDVNFSNAAYSTWAQRDPHARAYDVLLTDASRQMIAHLGENLLPAHENRRCLACHSPYVPETTDRHSLTTNLTRLPRDRQEQLQDGVSCEACHGAASEWLGPHTEAGWRSGRTAAQRQSVGFSDLRTDLAVRARTCTQCHVGGPGRDVDHDLIAAGHPRLNFEFAAFHANLPPHWDTQRDQRSFPVADQPGGSTLEVRLWLIGQLTTTEASLNLLETRATAAAVSSSSTTDSTAPWPEFAEYGCFACHHDLQVPSWRQQGHVSGRKPGSYPWGTWNLPLLKSAWRTSDVAPLSEQLQRLELTMSQPAPDTDLVFNQARSARQLLTQEIHQQAELSLTATDIHHLLQQISGQGAEIARRDWDAAAQVYLATVSLYQAQQQARASTSPDHPLLPPSETQPSETRQPEILQHLAELRAQLQFPAETNSPRNLNTDRMTHIQQQLKTISTLVQKP